MRKGLEDVRSQFLKKDEIKREKEDDRGSNWLGKGRNKVLSVSTRTTALGIQKWMGFTAKFLMCCSTEGDRRS